MMIMTTISVEDRAVKLSYGPFITQTPLSRRQYYYWYLTVEGIAYLREYLNLPQDVVPQTHTKKETRPARPAGFGGKFNAASSIMACFLLVQFHSVLVWTRKTYCYFFVVWGLVYYL